jgi:hypothetical protein
MSLLQSSKRLENELFAYRRDVLDPVSTHPPSRKGQYTVGEFDRPCENANRCHAREGVS